MTTRDEKAALENHIRAMEDAIARNEKSKATCSACGINDLLRNEVWKLKNPPKTPVVSRKMIAAIATVVAAVATVIMRKLGL